MDKQTEFLNDIGRRIENRRKELGLTQEALAEKSNVTTQFVSYAENGKRAMRPENLLGVANALGVSTDYILKGDIIDRDILIMTEKLEKLSARQFLIVEAIVDDIILLNKEAEKK